MTIQKVEGVGWVAGSLKMNLADGWTQEDIYLIQEIIAGEYELGYDHGFEDGDSEGYGRGFDEGYDKAADELQEKL